TFGKLIRFLIGSSPKLFTFERDSSYIEADDISREKWMVILQNLKEEDIEWRAPWILPNEILYRCGNFGWVPLLRIWGAVGYAPLLVLRQYRRWLQKEDSRDVQCLEPDSTDEEIGNRFDENP
ncbi:hypothetical protein Goari_004677, partial [Gossypium aridum]|nr:hypothetical protein [Gossypium aridum]